MCSCKQLEVYVYCVTIIAMMSAASIYVVLRFEWTNEELNSMKLALQCMECCVGPGGCHEEKRCGEMMRADESQGWGIGSFCSKIPNYSEKNVAQVVDRKLHSVTNFNVIDQVAQDLARNTSEEKLRSLKKKLKHRAWNMSRPSGSLFPLKQSSTTRNGRSARCREVVLGCGVKEKGGFHTGMNCSVDRAKLTIVEGGFYSVHLHTTIRGSYRDEASYVVKQRLFKQEAKVGKEEELMADSTPTKPGFYSTMDNNSILHLVVGDRLYAKVESDSPMCLNPFKLDSYFSLFLIST